MSRFSFLRPAGATLPYPFRWTPSLGYIQREFDSDTVDLVETPVGYRQRESGSGTAPFTYVPFIVSPEKIPLGDPRIGIPASGSDDLSVQDFLNQCMTADQVQEILNELNIEFHPSSGYAEFVKDRRLISMPPCKQVWLQGDSATRSIFSGASPSFTMFGLMMKAFQFLRWIRFDSPMPISETANPYEWLKRCNIKWNIMGYVKQDGVEGAKPSNAGGYTAQMHTWGPESSYFNTWSVVETAYTMMHELRHTIPGGAKNHSCLSHGFRKMFGNAIGERRCDYEITEGGACASGYWFWVWLRHHFRPEKWSNEDLAVLDSNILSLWRLTFCLHNNQYQEQFAGPPPLDPLRAGDTSRSLVQSLGRAFGSSFAGAGLPLFSQGMQLGPVIPSPIRSIPSDQDLIRQASQSLNVPERFLRAILNTL